MCLASVRNKIQIPGSYTYEVACHLDVAGRRRLRRSSLWTREERDISSPANGVHGLNIYYYMGSIGDYLDLVGRLELESKSSTTFLVA